MSTGHCPLSCSSTLLGIVQWSGCEGRVENGQLTVQLQQCTANSMLKFWAERMSCQNLTTVSASSNLASAYQTQVAVNSALQGAYRWALFGTVKDDKNLPISNPLAVSKMFGVSLSQCCTPTGCLLIVFSSSHHI